MICEACRDSGTGGTFISGTWTVWAVLWSDTLLLLMSAQSDNVLPAPASQAHQVQMCPFWTVSQWISVDCDGCSGMRILSFHFTSKSVFRVLVNFLYSLLFGLLSKGSALHPAFQGHTLQSRTQLTLGESMKLMLCGRSRWQRNPGDDLKAGVSKSCLQKDCFAVVAALKFEPHCS